MSRECTLCRKTIDGIHYVCKYGSGAICPCTLHPHCFEKAQQDAKILLSCQCHPLHKDSFVREQVEEDTSDRSEVAESEDEEDEKEEDEKKKNSDFQGHPDDLVWFHDGKTDGWRQIKRSEAEELDKIDDAKGIARVRGT